MITMTFSLLAFSLPGGLEAKEKTKMFLAEVDSGEATTEASQGQDYGLDGLSLDVSSCRKKDISFWGSDLQSKFRKTVDGCADTCQQMRACKAWTFTPGGQFLPGLCRLKKRVPTNEVTRKGVWSGVKDCATTTQTRPRPRPSLAQNIQSQ